MPTASGTQTLATTGGFVGITTAGRVLYAAIVNAEETLYSINADGTGLIAPDTASASDRPVAVAANGRNIYQWRVTNNTSIDLYAINADGTARVRLTVTSFFMGLSK